MARSSAEEIVKTLREKIKQDEKFFEGARRAGFPDIIDGLGVGSYSFLGDDYGPTAEDIDALVQMYDITYINASRYKTAPWAIDEFNKFCEPLRQQLINDGVAADEIEDQLPLFEDWFIHTYRKAWIWLIKGKISDIVARSQTAFEREQMTEETARAYSALAMQFPYGKRGLPSTLTSPISIEDDLKKSDEGEE